MGGGVWGGEGIAILCGVDEGCIRSILEVGAIEGKEVST